MNVGEMTNAVRHGQSVTCTREEYFSEIKQALKDLAKTSIDGNQHRDAMVALAEIKRLDIFFRDQADELRGIGIHKKSEAGELK